MSPPTAPSSSARLAWLDLLRGIAALVVALHHSTYYFTPGLRARMGGWIDPGIYGVFVFFLVSGYIIPASLERHGRVRAFWISRLTRIYPLLTVACALMLLPVLLGVRELRAGLGTYDPAVAVLAHATMLQDVLGVPNEINVLWTLSYEMTFYLLVVALFVTGSQRRSAPIAVGLASCALLAGGLLPTMALTKKFGVGSTVMLTALLMAAAITAAASGRPALRMAGGLGGGVLALVLVTVNGRVGPWESLVILAVMFTGTALYRAEHGQIGRPAAALSSALVLAAAIAAAVWNAGANMPSEQVRPIQTYWAGSILAAAVTFAAAWTLRHRRIPRWLTALGTISFSLYLLHPVLLMLSDELGGIPDHDSGVRLAVFVLALVAVSFLTYRYIELPFQRLGRRLARGSTPPPVHAAPSVSVRS